MGTSVPNAAAATVTAPYTDPDAVGYIGLCNQAGQQVTSGSVNAQPFAWLAVSSEPSKAPYNGTGRTATLDAFLPVQSLPAGDWSGETLTAATGYSNPTVPMAAGTTKDTSLKDFMEDFAPNWDGFIELRLILSAPGQEADSLQYPALNIEVSGTTWTAVGGGTVSCTAGTAKSLETVLTTPTTTTTTDPHGAASSSPSTTQVQGPSQGGASTGSQANPGSSGKQDGSAPSQASTGSGGTRSGDTGSGKKSPATSPKAIAPGAAPSSGGGDGSPSWASSPPWWCWA